MEHWNTTSVHQVTVSVAKWMVVAVSVTMCIAMTMVMITSSVFVIEKVYSIKIILFGREAILCYFW